MDDFEVAVLEVRGVGFSYPLGPPAINALSLAIRPGRRLAFLGGNGSGKSTLLMLMNGSLRPSSGQIFVNGEPVRYSRSQLNSWRRQVGLVLQDPDDQLFSASVYEDVSFGPLNLCLGEAEARRRVDETLQQLGLADLADRPAHMLSYGQRKRVAIAGVAAMHPKIVLLDEPISGLDLDSADGVLAMLAVLNSQGSTTVITTHDVELALSWADDVAVLSSGQIKAVGSPWEVLSDTELCQTARIRRPSLIQIVDAAQHAGVLDIDARPNSWDEFAQLLKPAG